MCRRVCRRPHPKSVRPPATALLERVVHHHRGLSGSLRARESNSIRSSEVRCILVLHDRRTIEVLNQMLQTTRLNQRKCSFDVVSENGLGWKFGLLLDVAKNPPHLVRTAQVAHSSMNSFFQSEILLTAYGHKPIGIAQSGWL